MTPLELKVLQKLKEIPAGKVTTYGYLAEVCGVTNGARFIGNVMRKNPRLEKFPCYKVVKQNGEIGEYSGEGGRQQKIVLLQQEGVRIVKGRIVDLEKYLSKVPKF